MSNLSFYYLFRVFLKNIFIIVLSAIVFGVAAFCYCEYFVDEKFAAKGSVLVTNGAILGDNSDRDYVQNSDISASVNLTPTIKGILLEPGIYKRLAEQLDGKYTYSELKSYAKVSGRDDNSLFIDVTFETTDKEETVKITNAFLELAPAYIQEKFPAITSATISTADAANKTSPRTTTTTVSALFIGAVLCYAIIFLISLNNVTIQSEEDFKDHYDIPVLGNVPDFAEAQNKKYANYYKKGGSYYANYK